MQARTILGLYKYTLAGVRDVPFLDLLRMTCNTEYADAKSCGPSVSFLEIYCDLPYSQEQRQRHLHEFGSVTSASDTPRAGLTVIPVKSIEDAFFGV